MAAAAELRLDEWRGAPAVGVHGLPTVALARLRGVEPEGAARGLLSVRTATAGEGLPALLGEWRVEAGVLRFRPRFPFRPGLGYRARFDGALFDRLTGAGSGTTPDLELSFVPAGAENGPATRVEAVYPSADLLPANQLRLYIWFSAPMRRRRIVDGIRLVEAGSGVAVELPFVEVNDGLWDPSGRRLTLFFHPGRLKRGVGPRVALGPPLRQGGRYRLEIASTLRDARGRPLAEEHVKRFVVGPPDRSSPDPLAWSLAAPRAERDPLLVEFPEPLDHGLLARLLEVRDAAGRPVAGEVVISHHERRWAFEPEQRWAPGGYHLRVSTALEDLAGNTPLRLFDEETAAGREPKPPEREAVNLGFVVGADR